MQHVFQRKDPHHEIIELPGKPTVLFITLGIESMATPWLADPLIHDTLRTVWQQALAWRISYYLLMPDHLHFFAVSGDRDCPLSRWMRYWKREFARAHPNPQHRFQTDYWDTTLRSHAHYTETYAYVRLNPVRKALVTQPDAWMYQGCLHDFVWIDS